MPYAPRFRISKHDDKSMTRLRVMYEMQFTDNEIAKAFGTTARRLNTWLRRRENTPLRYELEELRAVGNVKVRAGWYAKCCQGDLSAIRDWLRAFDPAIAERISGNGNGAGDKKRIEDLTESELNRQIFDLMKQGGADISGLPGMPGGRN